MHPWEASCGWRYGIIPLGSHRGSRNRAHCHNHYLTSADSSGGARDCCQMPNVLREFLGAGLVQWPLKCNEAWVQAHCRVWHLLLHIITNHLILLHWPLLHAVTFAILFCYYKIITYYYIGCYYELLKNHYYALLHHYYIIISLFHHWLHCYYIILRITMQLIVHFYFGYYYILSHFHCCVLWHYYDIIITLLLYNIYVIITYYYVHHYYKNHYKLLHWRLSVVYYVLLQFHYNILLYYYHIITM